MSWFSLAFVAPLLWAVVFVIDTYLIDSVYEDEFDGAMVTGVFQLLPWLLVPLGVIQFTPFATQEMILAVIAGMLLLFSFFCYFKALFVLNDAALMQILWNISVLLVPFLSFLIAGEVLLPVHYIGIGIAFLGVILFSFHGASARDFPQIALPMLGAIVFLSLSAVVSKEVYKTSPEFWSVFLLFSLGAISAVAVLLVFDKKPLQKRVVWMRNLNKKYIVVFLISELFTALGVITSQGAIRLAPSVSFVILIESLTPVFGMMISLGLVLYFKVIGHEKGKELYQQQFAGLTKKIVAIVLISIAIYLIN